jgi:hypothetical protein
MQFPLSSINARIWALTVVLGVLGLASARVEPLHARTAEFRTEPPAAASGPGEEAMSALIEDVRTLAEEFQLTSAQQIQAGFVLIASAQELQRQLEPIAARRAAIDSALRTDPVDSALLHQLASEQGAAAAGLSRLEIETRVAVRALLDDSQLMLLEELRALLRDRLSQWVAEGSAKSARSQLSRTALRRGGPRTGDPMLDAAAEMGLSPDQRAAVRSIMEAAVPEALALGSDLAANRQALGDTARSTPEDLATIDALIDVQAGLFEALVLLRIDVTLQVLEVLTADQLALIGHLAPVLREHMGGLGGDL